MIRRIFLYVVLFFLFRILNQFYTIFQDIYYNLTLKTVMGLKWCSIYCNQAKYVMKTDDDIFVNIPLLHWVAVKESQTPFANQISGK